MVFDCGACLAKYVLCFFNFVIFLAATAILGVGIWLAVDKNSFIGLSKIVPVEELQQFTQPAVIEQASYVLIGVGAFMFIISFLGYCGALKESQCLLTTYGICLVIILVLEIVVGVVAVVHKARAEQELKTALKKSIEKYYVTGDHKDAVTLTWDHLQANLHCCGVDNSEDFRTSIKFLQGNKTVPESCCVLEEPYSNFKPKFPNCTYRPSAANSYHDKGCYEALMNWIMANVEIIVGVAIGLGLLELVGIFLSFCLSKSLNQHVYLK